MPRPLLPFALACACARSGAPAHPPPPPALPAASTVCYAGTSTGMGQQARTIARRTVDPAAGTITEDVAHDAAAAHGAKAFHVVMTVTGEQFAMAESGGAFRGSGQLAGEPWKWNAWSSVSQIAGTDIEVRSDDELTETGMKATKQIQQGGKVIATTVDELRTFDCAQWDAVAAALTVPPLDDAACERACRNFATLRFWAQAEPAIAAQPAAAQASARATAEAELAGRLTAGAPACVQQCRSANDAVTTHCLGEATTVDALAACQK